MTELELRNLYVETARSCYGIREGSARHRELIDLYNSLNPLPRGYRMTESDDWCLMFAVSIAVKLGLTDIIFPECSCIRAKAMYQAAGRWTGDRSYVPQPGDFLLFDWQPNASPDHWATVVRVTGDTIRTIEGNMGNRVWHRDVKIGDSRIHGYCLPDYAAKAGKEVEDVARFDKVEELPEYARPTIGKLVENGILKGDEHGDLNLSEDMMRILVILDRAGKL